MSKGLMTDWALFLTGAAIGGVFVKALFDVGILKPEHRRPR